MATFSQTVAQYNAAIKPFAAVDVVTLADTGAILEGLPVSEYALLAANGIDFIDATNDRIFPSLAQYEALGNVSLTASDTVILFDSGANFSGGTIAEISALAGRNVDGIDVSDNLLQFSAAQISVFQVSIAPDDVIIVSDQGTSISSLSPAQIGLLAGKGVVAIDSTTNALTLSKAQFDALGTVALTRGDVVTRNGTSIGERMVGTAFDDILQGLGGNDTLLSGVGAHVLKGGLGNDRLAGGISNDKLFGGLGRDVMSGSKGRDAFVFDAKSGKSNLDKVTDYSVKDDSVFLDNAVFRKLGSGSELRPGKLKKEFFVFDSAKERDDYLIYNKKSGVLFYDADGSGGGKAAEIAIFSKNLKLTAGDFFVI